jgi:hypothetical protein
VFFTKSWFFMLGFLACRTCASCFVPESMPYNGKKDKTHDTSQDDSEEDSDSEVDTDTALPPPCDYPEIEPNNNVTEAMRIPMEMTACGDISERGDREFLTFTPEEGDWILIDTQATEFGSRANLTMVVTDRDYRNQAWSSGRSDSEDPWIVYPLTTASAQYVYLMETDGGYGDDYEWKLLASVTKAPVDWNVTLEEPNSVPAEALSVSSGDTVFGFFDRSQDFDWLHIVAPEGEAMITAAVEAFIWGSPSDVNLWLYDGTVIENPSATPVKRAYSDTTSYNRDATLNYSTSGAGDYYLLIREANGYGSSFYWYSVKITITTY